MRQGRPSQTASFVALVRALADEGFTTVPGFSDPVARRMLSAGWVAARAAASRLLGRMPPEGRARTLAQIDVIPLRVVAIDAAIAPALGSCKQLVVLGAGLDTRAFRLTSLAEIAVFEVDHPATQAYKRTRIAALEPAAASVELVSVDFERESLGDRLAAAGFRADVPSVWIWEGVVMYLTDDAVRRTLHEVARLSPPGSVLVCHYHVPGGRQGARRAVLSLWREPHIGMRSPATMRAWLTEAGFDVDRDTSAAEWAVAFGASPLAGAMAAVARLVVASRKSRAREDGVGRS